MPELRPHHDPAGVMATPPSPRAILLWDGTYWRAARGHTDGTVQVRGEDQLFSYNRPVADCKSTIISGAGGWCNSESPTDGRVWVIKTVVAIDRTSPTTEHQGTLVAAVGSGRMFTERLAFAADDWSSWTGHVYLEHDDVIQVRFVGGLVNDSCRVCITGYEMIKEV